MSNFSIFQNIFFARSTWIQLCRPLVKLNKVAIKGQLDSSATDMFIISLGSIPNNYTVQVEYHYILESAIIPPEKGTPDAPRSFQGTGSLNSNFS